MQGQLFKYARGTLREREGGRRCTRGRFGRERWRGVEALLIRYLDNPGYH